MVTIQQLGLEGQLKKGLNRAKELSQGILVSYVKKIPQIDPLSFFELGQYKYNERTYWSDPSGEMTMVGLGKTFQVNKGNHAFTEVENEWGNLVNHCVSNGSNLLFTGPMLFGGFSFDPKKPKTNLWKYFPGTLMTLSRMMVTVTNEGAWLTTNVIVEPEGDLTNYLEEIRKDHKLLSDFRSQLNQSPAILVEQEDVQPKEWKTLVQQMANSIKKKELSKVVLARELKLRTQETINPVVVLSRLREEQPNSYIFAFEVNQNCFLGATPERLVRKSGDQLVSACLAGSTKRGKTISEDEQLGHDLLNDPKNLEEHAVVVQMIDAAFQSVSNYVEKPDKPILFKARDIQHLYTPIIGKINKDQSLLKVIERLHPTPALGGYPRSKAVEKIREFELLDRGWYAAPVGWLDESGNGEFAVAIRSGLVKGQEASLFAGCGIVGDSDPESEYRETEIKLKPMLYALGGIRNE